MYPDKTPTAKISFGAGSPPAAASQAARSAELGRGSAAMCNLLFLAILLTGLCQQPARSETAGKAQYAGGTVDIFKAGDAGSIDTTDPGTMIFSTRKLTLSIPYDRINLLEYGQNVSRRLVLAVVVSPLFLLSKARKHFLTVGFQDAEGRQQALVFRLDKSRVRVVLASLEARTGQKIQYQDEEARKAGRG
jgi:hypothetical protein